nr:ethylbenzene dehydrogenase-related protein [Methanohalophilus sp. RSK]
MAKYLNDAEIATITKWIDSTYTNDRTLGYDPYLKAVNTTDFDINDLVNGTDNPAWDKAEEHVISVVPTVYTATDKIKLKALYSDKYLYIRAEWEDPTASLTRSGSWIQDNGKWQHPEATTENDKQSEDRLAFFWNIDTPNFKARHGCAITCHGNVPGSAKFTDESGATMDIWHNKAARALGAYSATDNGDLTISTENDAFEATAGTVKFSGVADDKRLVWYMDTADGYNTEDSGRRGDAGKSAYGHNRNKAKSAPKFIETNPTSWADAMALTQTEIDNGETIVADPTDSAYDAATVADAWNKYADLGTVVPERILRKPEGSRGDVLNTAVWKDGVWVNEFRRPLVTGNADDVQFDLTKATEYDYSVAVFDNCGRGEIPPGHTTYGDGQYQVLRFAQETSKPAPSTPTPGFGALLAITGLLAVAYLVLRRRK